MIYVFPVMGEVAVLARDAAYSPVLLGKCSIIMPPEESKPYS